MRLAAFALAIGCLGSLAAEAQVRIKTLPDGRRVMTNDGSPRRPPSLAVERPQLDRMIETHARHHRLDPVVVQAMVRVESDYDPLALSHKGAMGLMQLMPETARSLEVADPYDPEENLRGGTLYLRRMLDRFGGNLALALAAYNAGPEAVSRYRGLPPFPETRSYVSRVLRLARGEDLSEYGSVVVGRPTFLHRDASGRLLLTTTPPAAR